LSELKIPHFPFGKPSELDAYKDWESLVKNSFLDLIVKRDWKSRSVIDESYCYNYVISKSNIGNKTSNCFHWQARMSCDSLTAPSPIRAWYDRKLRKNIENSIYYKDSHKSALSMRGYVASQFRPSSAKSIYELFNAKKIYDPCGGWGDRLSGALASDCELYYCRDVNPMVFCGYALQQQAYKSNTKTYFEYKGSEIDCPKEKFFDLVFTSPPYFKIEKYQGNLQSHQKYKKFNEWLKGFLFPMLHNAWLSLQENGVMAINISDCYANHTYNRICEPMIEYCINNLFNCNFVGVIGYEITSRKKGGANSEPIIIFSKGAKLDINQIILNRTKDV
tara:strand:- start:46 stop:1047 length:1002 start_codon:yes stop_codon:yes gene_type:complete